jgi:UPF0716 protein FxsA
MRLQNTVIKQAMKNKIILIFLLMSAIELALLIYVGMLIGPLYTILIVLGTAVVGGVLAIQQGRATLRHMMDNLARGILPSSELLDGVLIMAGGFLLIMPGLIADAAGLLMLLPQTRIFAGRVILKLINRKTRQGNMQYWQKFQ